MPDHAFDSALVGDGRVVVLLPLRRLAAAVATLAYCGLLYVFVEDGFPVHNRAPAYWIAFAIVTAIWLWYMARLKTTTVFDAADGSVRRRNLLMPVKSFAFDEVAEIVEVRHEEGMYKGSYFKIAPKANRYGKGYRLTKTYSGADPELIAMRTVVVPAIQAMLRPAGAAATEQTQATDLDTPRFYRRRGGKYARRFWRTSACFLAAGVAAAIFGIRDGNAWTTGFGIFLLVVPCVLTTKIVLDTDARLVRVYSLFGLRERRSVPFSAYLAVEATRNSGNGIYVGTNLEMRFDGEYANVPLAMAFFTGSLAGLADETEAIVRAGGRDAGM